MYLAFAATFWSRLQVYNPIAALIFALLAVVSLRFLLLVILETRRGVSVILLRLASGIFFGFLAWLYFLFVTPLLEWNRPARALAAIAVVSVLMWVIVRQVKGMTTQPLGCLASCGFVALYVILVVVATLSLLHTGYIALTGDRVTLLVNV
jgi:hypothetical protein